jgi:hypothetical protein
VSWKGQEKLFHQTGDSWQVEWIDFTKKTKGNESKVWEHGACQVRGRGREYSEEKISQFRTLLEIAKFKDSCYLLTLITLYILPRQPTMCKCKLSWTFLAWLDFTWQLLSWKTKWKYKNEGIQLQTIVILAHKTTHRKFLRFIQIFLNMVSVILQYNKEFWFWQKDHWDILFSITLQIHEQLMQWACKCYPGWK